MAKKNIKTRSKLKKAQAAVQEKQYETACGLYEEICQIDKRDAESWYMLGATSGLLGRHDEALKALQKCIELKPNHTKAAYNLGIALRENGNIEAALKLFKKVFTLEPKNTEVGDCLAHAYMQLGQHDEAIAIFGKLLTVNPKQAETWVNLGCVYQTQGKTNDAIECYKKAQALKPGIGFDNLGGALSSQGNYNEAIDCLREGLKLHPENHRAFSNILLTLNYVPDINQIDVLAEHKQWQQAYGKKIKPLSYLNELDPDKRLKIGYISPDMRAHSVANFFEPLLAAHNEQAVETYCYSSMPTPDAVTKKLQSLSHQWRDISRMTDSEVVKMIQEDEIDILVDMAGHTAGNHLTIFLHKPAPIQVSWLGYPNTTGLSTIDYRFTDSLADPDDQDEFYTEKLYRLADSFLCYQGLESSPDVSNLPAIDKRHITFGSFNNLAKMNEVVVELWARVFDAVEGSHLLIKNPSLSDENSRLRLTDQFVKQGISADRIALLGLTPTREAHLDLYSKIDIGLDIFPYNGTTTTCEALWMGVPVISLIGDRHAGRVGLSLLNAIGLQELAASSKDNYIDKAKVLAFDLEKLSQLRSGLREKMQGSILCDKKSFAGKMENAYRDIWRKYCATAQ